MDVIAIGDIHGRDTWKNIVRQNSGKQVIFLGDYFDSRNIPGDQQIENFREILEFRAANRDRVTLLLGNHDFHYSTETQKTCIGYGENGCDPSKIGAIINPAISSGVLQVVRYVDGVLYTHAGIGKNWSEKYSINLSDVEQSSRQLLLTNPQAYEMQNGNFVTDASGNDIHQGPLWIRPESLGRQPLDCKQVVGHTNQRKISFSENRKIAYIDTFSACGEYLEIKDGKFKVRGSRKIPKGKIDEMKEYFEKIRNEYRFKFREDFFYKGNKVPTSIIPVKRGDILGHVDRKDIISPIDGLLCSPYDFGDAFKMGYFFILREYSK